MAFSNFHHQMQFGDQQGFIQPKGMAMPDPYSQEVIYQQIMLEQHKKQQMQLGDQKQMDIADPNIRVVPRFTSSKPKDWVKPKSGYQTSNFRKEYKLFSRDNVNEKTVRDCLPYDALKMYDEFSLNLRTEEKCVKVWTLSTVYKELTQALYKDDRDNIKKYMPLIRGINKYLVTPTSREYITYRGSHMRPKQFMVYKCGNVYRAPSFVASSEDPKVAENFKSQGKYQIQFRIPKGCWNAAPIGHLSKYPHEKEVLLPAYTAFKVLNVSNNQIDVQVLDNRAADNNVESRFV